MKDEELEKTQVIEIPEEENINESEPAPEVPSINEVLEPSVTEVAEVKEETPAEEVNDIPEPVTVTEEVKEPIAEEEPVKVENNTVPASEVPSTNTEFVEKERKIWPIVTILVILVLAGLFAYYYFIYTKPINIINKLFNTAYGNIKETMGTSNDGSINIDTFILDSSLTITSDNKEFADYSGLSAKAYVAYDLKDNKKNKIDLSLALKEQKMLDMAMSMVGNKIYYDLKDAFPKVVYMETDEELMSMDSILIDQKEINDTVSDSLYIVEVVKNAILKNISEEKLSKKILLKDIDGKKIPAVEVNYKIDYQEYKKLYVAVFDALANDDKVLSIVSKLSGLSTKETKESFEYMRDDISELDLPSDIDVVIDIDAFTSKLVAMEIKNATEKMVLRSTSTETNIDYNSTSIGNVSITVDKKENKVFADFKLLLGGEEVTRFAVTVKVNESSKTSFDTNLSVVLYDTADINKEILTITGTFKLDINKIITTVNTVDATNVNDLTPAEMKKFEAALESLNGLSSIAEGAM